MPIGAARALPPLLMVALLGTAAAQRPKYRSFDGRGNNVAHPEWGALPFTPPGPDRPSARAISLALMQTDYPEKRRYLEKNTSGQYFDHDLDKIADGDPADVAPIPIPKGDPYYDPAGSGNRTMRFTRSGYNKTSTSPYRETINTITAFVDGSLVYGSSQAIGDRLRAYEGGRMRVVDDPLRGPMLPTVGSVNMSLDYMANDAGRVPPGTLRAMGDVRGNVDPPVLAFQTLWVREHNRLAEELAREHPDWDDEALFQEARKWNIALQQVEWRVCFYEYMPALGIRLPPYAAYNASVNPSIDTFFSTVSYRYGHSEINDVILRIDDSGREVPQGHLMLMQAYFNPNVSLSAGVEPVLRGLTTNVQGMVEPRFASAVQNFLFGLPGVNGSDLFARNIQRGRDHGIPPYNACRRALGLPPVATFAELTNDTAVAAALTQLYGTPDSCDAYVCGLAEKKLPDSHFGPLFNASMTDQYLRVRDGDWYYFENKANGAFTDEEIALIKGTLPRVGSANRGLATVQLSSSANTSAQVDELVSAGEYTTFRTHGILMAITFCILMPAAFLANRLKGAHFLRDSPHLIRACFLAHILLNVSAVALAAAAFALPLTRARDVRYSEVPYGHGRLGVAVLALLFLQAVYPWLRPAPSPLTPLRRAWELLHTSLGRAILVMGLVNVALGIHIINQAFNGSVRFFATLAAVPLASLALVGSVLDRLSSQSAAAAAASSSGGAAHANGGSDSREADEDVKGIFVQ
ncbi:hypothetical protein GPECTOR_37g145 [Gonium pectorale]|uniref:Cytochrome b561 domain-containing protein n=1 Tax=Gonium pectorale TaxID=33097 RepID=A0A150GCS5_GONPE|nr:hypothetical protein GPECTOR_37g145 [Gonium pectorale]|eukprot:KXZ47140.1 hypothetical protein GPECTOR_37g145 [Gonium pectorale]